MEKMKVKCNWGLGDSHDPSEAVWLLHKGCLRNTPASGPRGWDKWLAHNLEGDRAVN